MSSQRRSRRSKGFTFLEIMFVVVIIGILLALVGPHLVGRTQGARVQAAEAQIKGFETALKTYEMDMGNFPETLDEMTQDPDDVDNKAYKGPYLDTIPMDPWGQEYIYKPGKKAQNNKRTFDLYSVGPDKVEGGDDDIVNWTVKK